MRAATEIFVNWRDAVGDVKALSARLVNLGPAIPLMPPAPTDGQPNVAALIVAAGRGQRARNPGDDRPKQYSRLHGRAVLDRAAGAFAAHSGISLVQAVIHPDDRQLYDTAVEPRPRLAEPVAGAATRQGSVLRGLEALERLSPDYVLIHDAARPLVGSQVIDRAMDALRPGSGVLVALPVADTLKSVTDEMVTGTIPREGLWGAQTPQGFDFAAILEAHRSAAAAGEVFTDDVGVAEWAGLPVAVVEGSRENLKLTGRRDLAFMERIIGVTETEYRTGSGFDVHAFGPGRAVILGGVEIPHSAGLKGHSDADVVLHALTDALLGAVGAGDIGEHFPPSDPQWRGAASALFVSHALERVATRNGRLVNVDVTVICEAPKIGPHRAVMRARIAELCAIDASRVNVKATTTESLGFAGRKEGIAAMASATVALPIADKSDE